MAKKLNLKNLEARVSELERRHNIVINVTQTATVAMVVIFTVVLVSLLY